MRICTTRPICAPIHWLLESSLKIIRQLVHTAALRNPSLTCSICASILDSRSESFGPSTTSKTTCINPQILFLRGNKLRNFAFLVPSNYDLQSCNMFIGVACFLHRAYPSLCHTHPRAPTKKLCKNKTYVKTKCVYI